MSRATELAAAVRDALTVPDPAPGDEAASLAHLVLYARRGLHVRSALESLRTVDSYRGALATVRQAAEWHPVDYPTRDEQDGDA